MTFPNDIEDNAARLRDQEHPFVVATVVAYKSPQSARPGSKAIVLPDGSIDGWIGGGCVQPIVIQEALKALNTGKPKLLCISPDSPRGGWKGIESREMTCHGGGSIEIYLEPVLPKPVLLIVGNSPIAQILCGLGKLLDFKVSVADPDATRARFPEANAVLTDLTEARSRIDSSCYVVVATMGTGDEEGLEAVAGTTPKYLGLVASEKKAKGLFQYLNDKGVAAEDLERVKFPAGLSLGSETLPEIAVSVMAEITQLRRSPSLPAAQSLKPELTLPVMNNTPGADDPRETGFEAQDPVCGMTVDPAGARYTSHLEGATFYFCCIRCKDSFDRSPKSYRVQSIGEV